MASRLRGLIKFPWRAKKTKESEEVLYEELFKAEQDAAPEKNALTESNAAPGKHAAELFATKENAGPQRDAAPESYTAPGKNATERIVWSPGTRVVGKYDFKGRTREDLPFKKGEILIIETVTRDPKWYRAVDSEGRKGMIPFNFVRKCLTYPVEPLLWFHGDISRIETKRLLNPCEDGLFLIRNSFTYKGEYAISVCYADNDANNVKHYRVRVTDCGKLRVDDDVFYGSLSELVEQLLLYITVWLFSASFKGRRWTMYEISKT
ncbi:tyrosine-protein kinase CSK-like isoform X2 [Stylophora pistillata]|uniref:tyrosine-protein kinase CSK-like isoform X2 n=1 Tax=Stylophora pistillata TaxID=50429 RepID=UPI000C03D7CB|nr:tyrosine-protein kinase CSK-like isoform X2 [Stylophora pistillata]